MAIKITEDCIDCGACIPECPNNAIYETAQEWRFSDGNNLKGIYKGKNSGVECPVDEPQVPLSMNYFYIVADKCTECKGFHDEPQCAAACPVDCCISDEDNVETEAELLEKKASLHL